MTCKWLVVSLKLTASSHLKMDGGKMKPFLLGRLGLFSGGELAVSFGEAIPVH